MLNLTDSEIRIMDLTNFLKKLKNKLQETMLRTGIVETNLTGHFFLICDKFQNVTVSLNANISETTRSNFICNISNFKLDITQLNMDYLIVIL